MLNKKIVAILIAALAASGLSAHRCHDEDGNPISCTEKVVEGTGEVARDIVEVPVDAAGGIVDSTLGRGSILNPGNWGEGGRRRRAEAREDRRYRRIRD